MKRTPITHERAMTMTASQLRKAYERNRDDGHRLLDTFPAEWDGYAPTSQIIREHPTHPWSQMWLILSNESSILQYANKTRFDGFAF